tara:strand:+ start:5158 stop:7260 length:2103 start_codon:yes stop_codon:yes gene_type:complete
MEYSKKQQYPSWSTPGVYPNGSVNELGLNNDNLEDFSLGNWNSIVKDNRVFTLDTGQIPTSDPRGRDVRVGFNEGILERPNPLVRVRYNRELISGTAGRSNAVYGDILTDTITDIQNTQISSNPDNVPSINYTDDIDEVLDGLEQDRHIVVWGHYYSGGNRQAGRWDNRQFRQQLEIDVNEDFPNNNNLAYIKEIQDDNRFRFEFDFGENKGLVFERAFDELEIEEASYAGDFTHELFFPKELRFRNPSESSHVILSNVSSVPFINEDGFWELDILNDGFTSEAIGDESIFDFFRRLGAPNFEYNFFFDDSSIINSIRPNDEIFLIDTTTVNQNELLYYDGKEKLVEYDDTSYPLEVSFNVQLFNNLEFQNEISNENLQDISNLFYIDPELSEDDIAEFVGNIDFGMNNSYFTYQVIQWGDEKKLLSNTDIRDTYFFNLYDIEEYPQSDNYFLRKWFASQNREAVPIQDSVSHVYNTPGVKSIKIIVYRYDKSKSFLTQTYLVTKNIVVNDGLLQSQDFAVFGGTDFNFLPIGDNQVIIGGFDKQSEYHTSVSKIVKDDNFISEDYLQKASSKDYVEKINDGFLGEGPGQIDLSQTRIFTEPKDIYDFIGADKLEWITNGFDDLPINSLATDIFIGDDKCVVDLNPANSEFLIIQNQMGFEEQGILVGDYKVNQPQDGKIQRDGVMRTPLLETTIDEQAF